LQQARVKTSKKFRQIKPLIIRVNLWES